MADPDSPSEPGSARARPVDDSHGAPGPDARSTDDPHGAPGPDARSADDPHGVPELSVVVPVHNEAGNIGPVLAEVETALGPSLDFEIIFVDDGSSDASRDELALALPDHPRLKVVRHRAQCGQSAALRTGVAVARSPWIATLDGDGQNDAADILTLVRVRDRSDRPDIQMITGVRRTRRDNLLRRLSSRIANGIRRRVLRDATTDTGCGLKLFQREAFLALPFFDHMHRFLPALIQRGGGAVLEVPVSHRPRRSGTSHYGVVNRAWVGIVDMLGVAWLQRRMKIPIVERMDK